MHLQRIIGRRPRHPQTRRLPRAPLPPPPPPPPRVSKTRFMATLAAGGPSVRLPPDCTAVVFAPAAANVAAVAGAAKTTTRLTPTAAGDYIVSCTDGSRLRYVAVPFGTTPGRRASYEVLSTASLFSGSRHTDRRFNFWTVVDHHGAE